MSNSEPTIKQKFCAVVKSRIFNLSKEEIESRVIRDGNTLLVTVGVKLTENDVKAEFEKVKSLYTEEQIDNAYDKGFKDGKQSKL